MNDRVFVNNASLGVYAKVVQSDAYRDAKLRHLDADAARPARTETRPRSTSSSPRPTEATARTRRSCWSRTTPISSRSLAGAGTRERLDTGTLGVVAARVRSAGGRLPADGARARRAGRALPRPDVLVGCRVRGPLGRPGGGRPRRRGARDGAAAALRRRCPARLRVRLPRTAGLSPAARAVGLTTESLAP